MLSGVGEVEEGHQLESPSSALVRLKDLSNEAITHDAGVDDQLPLGVQDNSGVGCKRGRSGRRDKT